MKRYLPFLIIGAVLIVAVAAGAWLFRSSQRNDGPVTHAPPATSNTALAPNAAVPPTTTAAAAVADSPRMRGGRNAPVTIEEFGDYECPPCGVLHPELKKIEAEFGDKLRTVFRHYPLTSMHPHALAAAQAAEAAGLQGRFWEMHDRLYDNQQKWSKAPDARSIFINYARELGLDVDRFTRDMNGTTVSGRINNDLQRANSLRVTGTPTLFINGRLMPPQMMTPAGIRMAIRATLNQAG